MREIEISDIRKCEDALRLPKELFFHRANV
jgi:hypothetical protein